MPDNEETICQIAEGADLLIIDHYDLNITKIARHSHRSWKLVIFEDIGKRKIPVDLAINGSPSAFAMNLEKYGALNVLAGPKFQVIRSDLVEKRNAKNNPKELVKTFLIILGSGDGGGLLDQLVEFFDYNVCPAWGDISFDVVAGPFAEINHQVVSSNLTIHRSPDNLSTLTLNADLALSAGGQTLVELVYCGVPTVSVCIAENQRENLRAMDSMDSTIFLEDIESDKWKAVLGDKVFNLLGDCGLRKTLSNNSLGLVDGFGAQRISTALLDLLTS